jgi:linoleoyl-CoA desaturase
LLFYIFLLPVSKITFNNKQSPFFRALKTKVDLYFSSRGLLTSGNARLLRKAIYLIASAITLYTVLVFFTPPVLLSVGLCALLGINLAALGFNVMHEGGHQSFSRHKWLNRVSAYLLNGLGGNSYFWKAKHNINHHTYTNIEGHDADLEVGLLLRLHANQRHYWFHQFQHVYWVFLYGLSYVAWVFYQDFAKYFSGEISQGHPYPALSRREHLIFWSTKIVYTGLYLVLPILVVGPLKALVGYAIVTFVCGIFISVVFQLAHVVGNTQFLTPDGHAHQVEQEWAIHQISTTSNFATGNKFISWLLGGLNFQVEHHLFPRISHVHYPQISRLVRETCREFNVPYLEYPSMGKAFYSHLQYLQSMGKPVALMA